ncbi:S41 family peptidase [Psychrobacter jeotgali]|uniref:S41 family peptidase n=1 Tax=Psychrobacter jeotgali TaxID=179010 RepID=UPI00191B0949|nr:S41 family peptidase [Psychrobacter jeotgali]
MRLFALRLPFFLVPLIVKSKLPRPALVAGLLGFSSIASVQAAAAPNPVSMTANQASSISNVDAKVVKESAAQSSKVRPTADLQLIDLTDELSTNDDMLNAADQADDWLDGDDIDSIPDDSALIDDGGYIDTDIPAEVAGVSLNAISPETLKTFVAVVGLVRREYVDTVNDEELFNNAMSGMLTKLDSHAEFLDAEAYENLRAFTQGDVGDVGIKVSYQPEAEHWVVTEVTTGSSAADKGIAVGDYLHQVDEFKLDIDIETYDIKQLLTGIAGTQVDVVTSKAGRRKRVSTLQRNNTNPQTIEARLDNGIAIIKLPVFQDDSREKLLNSLTRLNAPVSGILLDLRDNPGGVLTSAINVASLFMTDSDVVKVKGRDSEQRTLSTRGAAILKPLPVAILQNRYSASAAEVLASSLQTQKRATIIGELSYGKGSVQSVIALDNEQAVKLTVAHYLTPDGREIENVGVKPDVILSGKENTWEQQALSVLRQKTNPANAIRFVQKSSTQGSSAP